MLDARGARFVDTIWHDLRCALRTLTKTWGLTALAVASLGIGLGANTALFSLVDALLRRSLPVADPARLVLVFAAGLAAGIAAVAIASRAVDHLVALAAILPALRAARVDPLTAIRSE